MLVPASLPYREGVPFVHTLTHPHLQAPPAAACCAPRRALNPANTIHMDACMRACAHPCRLAQPMQWLEPLLQPTALCTGCAAYDQGSISPSSPCRQERGAVSQACLLFLLLPTPCPIVHNLYPLCLSSSVPPWSCRDGLC